jgi:hypothetical protein
LYCNFKTCWFYASFGTEKNVRPITTAVRAGTVAPPGRNRCRTNNEIN